MNAGMVRSMDDAEVEEWLCVLDRLDLGFRATLLRMAHALAAPHKPERRPLILSSMSREERMAGDRVRLSVIRRHFGLSDHEMAARLGMSVRTYRRWEIGPRKSYRNDTAFVMRLTREFGVSVEWYIHGEKGHPSFNDRTPFGFDKKPLPPVLRVVSANGR